MRARIWVFVQKCLLERKRSYLTEKGLFSRKAPAASRTNSESGLDVPGHPPQTSIDFASLAPNAEITVYSWKEPEDLKQRTIDRVRRFLKAHMPMRAAAQ